MKLSVPKGESLVSIGIPEKLVLAVYLPEIELGVHSLAHYEIRE